MRYTSNMSARSGYPLVNHPNPNLTYQSQQSHHSHRSRSSQRPAPQVTIVATRWSTNPTPTPTPTSPTSHNSPTTHIAPALPRDLFHRYYSDYPLVDQIPDPLQMTHDPQVKQLLPTSERFNPTSPTDHNRPTTRSAATWLPPTLHKKSKNHFRGIRVTYSIFWSNL